VKLASNEGQFGPLPAAVEAIARAVPALNRYPERARELRERLAARHGVTVDRVAVGNGADSLVGLLSLAFLDAGDEALTAWPSFVTYRLAAVAAVRKVQNAFDTSELGHVAALASLDAPPAELARRRADTAAGREAIAAALAAAGFEPRPSVANFVYADVGDGRALADRLEREGVIVRPLAPFGAPEAIRVTVGTSAEIERFAAALAGALERA
jgi:histidinol-phosphate/aromatic aminotransferase/cobyric acid decarboxylase-like protein